MSSPSPTIGQFVSLRGRLWLVEEEPTNSFDGHVLACVDDDASGDQARVLWSAEVNPKLLDEEAWNSLGRRGGDDPAAFSAYLRTVKWRTATAAERDLFQAPFRAGIRLDAYQLLPLRKALRLPRVNLLIADDVGLGKTVEAGLVGRELLLRGRVDFTVVIAPATMTSQWREELQTKFGLRFEIIDRRHLEQLRRRRGYGANPWAAGSRFILSHKLVGEEAYVAGLRDVLQDFRARSLLILDEAHHAAPAGGGRYAVESQFTRELRDLAGRFEHRLFLSATPHNGHSNSFATLLELLDPQRFTRGVPVRPADLEPIMVRRLKSDLRALGERFPERVVEPVTIADLPADAPELRLAAMLADYRTLREQRIGALGRGRAAQARLAFVGLQQRLLSSIPAFARTLRVHIAGLDRLAAESPRDPGADATADATAKRQAAMERSRRAASRTADAALVTDGEAAGAVGAGSAARADDLAVPWERAAGAAEAMADGDETARAIAAGYAVEAGGRAMARIGAADGSDAMAGGGDATAGAGEAAGDVSMGSAARADEPAVARLGVAGGGEAMVTADDAADAVAAEYAVEAAAHAVAWEGAPAGAEAVEHGDGAAGVVAAGSAVGGGERAWAAASGGDDRDNEGAIGFAREGPAATASSEWSAVAWASGSADGDEEVEEAPDLAEEEPAALERLARAEEQAAVAAAMVGGAGGALPRHAAEVASQIAAERAQAAAMLAVAEAARHGPDARVRWLLEWARRHLMDADGQWRERRLILFTEYEDTRRWLQRQLSALLDPADPHEDERIDSFTGITSAERREAIKRAFNDPAHPIRILICTDAAREGINLQSQCHDLIHVDLPWNPSRLEQRNGRIDRKLQPSDTVTCRYFVYAQRPEDVVLDALVRKTELIRRQLGSAGQVLGDRIAARLSTAGIARGDARDLAERIRDEEAGERVRAAQRELDDGEAARLNRLRREQADLARALEQARARVGVNPDELQSVVGLALSRATGRSAGERAAMTAASSPADTPVFALDEAAPAFADDPGWQSLFDELRARAPRAGEKPGEWRASADAAVRRISFAPAILPDGRDAGDVVQLHLEHRIVRRLLGRFLSAGFQQGLDRACVIETPATATARVVLVGRLALYGEGAARLHEEVLSVAADWRDRRLGEAMLRPLAEGRDAEARVLDELIAALAQARAADPAVTAQVTAGTPDDVTQLRPTLEARAAARAERVAGDLTRRAEAEAQGLEKLLRERIARIQRERGEDDRQFALLLDEAEARQRAADRRSWERTATRLDDELIREPERLRAAGRVRAQRLEPIGLIYLWPQGARA